MSTADPTPPAIDPRRAAIAHSVRLLTTELVMAEPDETAVADAAALIERAVALLAEQPRAAPLTDPARAIAEAPWTAIRRGPFVGQLNPLAPPIMVSEADGLVTGMATYGPAYEGPPNCVHGGMIAAGFDEVLGVCQGLTARPGMTAKLDVKYRSPTPLLQLLRYTAHIERIDGRKIYARAELRVVADDRLCAEADGMFVSVNVDRFLNL